MSNLLFAELDEQEAPGAYRVLARKYRPQSFAALIGQEALVRTLSNAIESGRLAQAYMLTGVRGVGKTTTARIIARALNCVGADGKGGPTTEPCGTCPNCEAITQDRHVDVLEMDAASRRGVDDIREIVDGVRYGPTSARYKIYIIDEVHMLSTHAFNALLKTLEEPPPHTKFIFATTEIRKVPVTVLSRCQRFDLRRVDSDVLLGHFRKVADWEKAEAEEDALALIARAADGSVRDGLSLLDQAIARGSGKVTTQEVRAMLGLADRARLVGLFEALHKGQMKEALSAADDLRRCGADALVTLQDLADIAHILTRAKAAPELLEGHALPELERKLAQDLGEKLSMPILTRTWQMLLKGMQEVQFAPDSHKALEMVLIRIAYASDMPPPSDLMKKLQEQGALDAPPSSKGGHGNGGGTVAMRSHGNLALAVETPNPQPRVMAHLDAQTEAAAALHPMPADFRALVSLFEEKKEVRLFTELYTEVNLVSYQQGHLEIRVSERAPQNLAGKVMQHVQNWTGQRLMVSLSSAEGAPSLAEQDRAKKEARWKNAESHPLVQATLKTFPDAKMIGIRTRAKAPEAVPVSDINEGLTFEEDDNT